MRHVRMLGLCLVAVFALGALASSSAMAGPQWVKCEKASELEAVGYPFEAKLVKYVDANCTEKSPTEAREYVLLKAPEVENLRVNYLGKPADVPFTGHSIGSGGLLTAGVRYCAGAKMRSTRQACEEAGGQNTFNVGEGGVIECEAESNEGGYAEGKSGVAGVTVRFTGCYYLGSYPCESAGAEPGEIVTNELKGKLGYINKSAKEVGVVLEPAQLHGRFAVFTCNGGILEANVGVGNKKEGAFFVADVACNEVPYCGEMVENPETKEMEYVGPTPKEEAHGGYDQVISPITPVNQMTSEFTQVYTSAFASPWGNVPHQLEGKHISALEVYLQNTLKPEAKYDWVTAGEEITNVNVSEEEGEIKA